jgi:radical SAM protein with 4Fe4S-binding SPASM domain
MTSFTGFPFIVGWELTLACNLRCLHCASRAGEPRPQELSLNEAFSIADQLPDLLVQEVIFTGGEPLISPLWEPLARHLTNLEIRPGMVTNGILLNKDTVSRMRQAGIGALAISLDGLKETHEHTRGRAGLFDPLIAGIRQALDAGMETTIITTVNALNINQLEDILEFLYLLGVKRWQLQPVFAFGRTRDTPELPLSPQEYVRLGEFIKSHKTTAGERGFRVFGADGVGYFSDLVVDTPPPWRGCSAGVASCGIMSDGGVKGCLSWPDTMVEGNLRRESLWRIWFRDNAFLYTRNFTKEDMHGACRDCDKAMECGGGCTAVSLAATGKLHGNPFCFRAISKAQCLSC